MPTVVHKDTSILVETVDFVKSFSSVFSHYVEKQEIKKGRWNDENNLAAFAEQFGIGGSQIKRYCDGDQVPTLEVFRRICLKLQIDPSQLLGLSWTDNTKLKNGLITRWKFDEDLQGGGLRLFWYCDDCRKKNIEYLDGDGTFAQELDNIRSDKKYKTEKVELIRELFLNTSFVCEHCSSYHSTLKGVEKIWQSML